MLLSPDSNTIPDLEVVVLNWNGRELLRACLASLLAIEPESEVLITVVDNASTDGSVAMLRADFADRIRVIESPKNGGFARGNNLALEGCRARYALLLNSDATLADGGGNSSSLDALVVAMDDRPAAGVLGPRILGDDGRVEESTGATISLWSTIATKLLRASRLPRSITGRVSKSLWTYDREREVDWVSGAALVVRGEILREGCLLDEGYFMYTEDVEWCHRIRERGWRVVFWPGVTVTHAKHGSAPEDARATSDGERRRRRLHREGVLRFTELHPSAGTVGLRMLVRAWMAIDEGREVERTREPNGKARS